MASTRGALIVGLALAAAACSRPAEPQRWPGGTIVDLSHDYSSETVFWPTADPFKLEKVADGMTPQGYYYAANNFATSEHGGTHLDAPVHFAQGHWSVDQIPLDRLTGDAIVVDVTAASARQPDYRVTVDDFTEWEKKNGEIAHRTILARSRHARNPHEFWNSPCTGPDSVGEHTPCARRCAKNRLSMARSLGSSRRVGRRFKKAMTSASLRSSAARRLLAMDRMNALMINRREVTAAGA